MGMIMKMIRVRFKGDSTNEIYVYDQTIRDVIPYLFCAVDFESRQLEQISESDDRDVWISEETQDQYVSQSSFRILDGLIRGDFENEISYEVFDELLRTVSYLGVENCDDLLAKLIDEGSVFYAKAKQKLELLRGDSREDECFVEGVKSIWNLPWSVEKTKRAIADLVVFLSHHRSMIENLPAVVVEYIWRNKRRRYGLEIDVLRVALNWFNKNPDLKMFINFSSGFHRDSLLKSSTFSALMNQHETIANIYKLCQLTEKKKLQNIHSVLSREYHRILQKTKVRCILDGPDFLTDIEFENAREICKRLATSLVTSKSGKDFASQMINQKPRDPTCYGVSYIVSCGNELFEYNLYLKKFRLLTRLPQSCSEFNPDDLIVVSYETSGVVLTIAKSSRQTLKYVPFWIVDFGIIYGEAGNSDECYNWRLLANEVIPSSCTFEKVLLGNCVREKTRESNLLFPMWAICQKHKDGYFINKFLYFEKDTSTLVHGQQVDVTGKRLLCFAYHDNTLYLLKKDSQDVILEKLQSYNRESHSCVLPSRVYRNNLSLFCLSNGDVAIFLEGNIHNVSKKILKFTLLLLSEKNMTQFEFFLKDDRIPSDCSIEDDDISQLVGESVDHKIMVRYARNRPYEGMFDGRIIILDLESKTVYFKCLYSESKKELTEEPKEINQDGRVILTTLPKSHRDAYCVSYHSRIPSSRLCFWTKRSYKNTPTWTAISCEDISSKDA